MVDCKVRRALWTTTLKRRALAIETLLSQFESMMCSHVRREVRKRQTKLWGAQKWCNVRPVEWLENKVRKQAKAAGDDNWKNHLDDMIKTTENEQLTGN